MGTRTYSRRRADGTRVPTAAGRARGIQQETQALQGIGQGFPDLPPDIAALPSRIGIVKGREIARDSENWSDAQRQAWNTAFALVRDTIARSPETREVWRSYRGEDNGEAAWNIIINDILASNDPRQVLTTIDDYLKQFQRTNDVTVEWDDELPARSSRQISPEYDTRQATASRFDDFANQIIGPLLALRWSASQINDGVQFRRQGNKPKGAGAPITSVRTVNQSPAAFIRDIRLRNVIQEATRNLVTGEPGGGRGLMLDNINFDR